MKRKPISQMNSQELKESLSIAGSPEKMMRIMDKMLATFAEVDGTNIAEIINLQIILKRVLAEAAQWERRERNHQHPPQRRRK